MEDRNVRLIERTATGVLIGALLTEIFLVAAYWTTITDRRRHPVLSGLFDMDAEAAIPAWFSSAQLLMIGLAFFARAIHQPRQSTPSKPFFTVAGALAIYVSMDETARIHERFSTLLRRRYIDWLPQFLADNLWVVAVGAMVLVALVQLFARDVGAIWNEDRRLVILGLFGACVAIAGGMGVEVIGYKLLHLRTRSIGYRAEVAIEEFLEMFGASLALFAAIRLSVAPIREQRERTIDRSAAISIQTPSRLAALEFE